MGYDFKVEIDGQGDITSKISSFTIQDSMGQYAREVTLAIDDPVYWDTFDFSTIPTAPKITVYTKVGEDWVSQGQFYIEKPSLQIQKDSTRIQSLWGRSKNARLGPPFAGKITKTWKTATTFFGIVAEMAELVGLSFDSANSEVADYMIHSYSYAVDSVYPIDVISELADLVGGMVSTDKDDNLRIVQYDFNLVSPKWEIADVSITELVENLEFPEFGNRIRITPGGTVGGYSISIYADDGCLPADGSTKARVYVQVYDSDGVPVQNETVNWTHNASSASLDYEQSNTQEVIFQDVEVKANTYYKFTVDLIPSQIDSVYAYSDKRKTSNLMEDGYTIDGREVTLTSKLAYCDETLIVTYRAEGVAVNYLQAGTEVEDVTVTAEIGGQEAEIDIFVGNLCECPISLSLEAFPSSIKLGESSDLLVYAEAAGAISYGMYVFMSTGTSDQKLGDLKWDYAILGDVKINNQDSVARNEIPGTTQCTVDKFIQSVTGVYQVDEDGDPTGSNLYSSFNGKVIDLNTVLETGTPLLVTYTIIGAAINRFDSTAVGTAEVKAWVNGHSEKPIEATATIQITNDEGLSDTPSDAPPDWQPEDITSPVPGGVSGADGDPTPPIAPDKEPGCGKTSTACPEGKECCHPSANPDEISCNDPADCLGGGLMCPTTEVNDKTSDAELQARFPSGTDCTCNDYCTREFDKYGTTQGYDGGSMVPIADMVTNDYGLEEGTAEYDEKYEELRQEAIDDCFSDCGACGDSTIGYTTLSMQKNESQTLTISNVGTAGVSAYSWEITSGGGTLGEQAEDGSVEYTAPSTNAGCSDNPTIALSCNGEEIDSITIGINAYTGDGAAYSFKELRYCNKVYTGGGFPASEVAITCTQYHCSGTVHAYCDTGTVTISQLGLPQCGDDAIYAAYCSFLYLGYCNQQTPDTFKDLRTQGMIDGGCCPGAIL